MEIMKMISFVIVFSTCVVLTRAVAPLTAEELQQIRDFTNKAHMKRMNVYPDQLMTPSHYLGRRIPLGDNKPTIFMQVPTGINNNNGGVKPTTFSVEQQTAGAVQNYLVNYAPVQQQVGQPLQRPVQPQTTYQFVPLQNPNGPPPRGPPPQRPPFFSIPGLSESPPSSLLQFFFPKRHSRRPSFRLPFRFEYGHHPGHGPPAPIYQHQQNLHSVMAQQHLLTVQQQQQQQQQAQTQQAQPSSAPVAASSTTLKTTAQASPTILPSSIPASHQPQLITASSQGVVNQFHKEINPFYGKPFGKPPPHQKFTPLNAFVPQNRPGDAHKYLQNYLGPQDYSFVPLGPHVPSVIAGPTSNKFGGPVSFSHIEQMPYPFQPRPLPMAMVVQSQEFPNYHFSTSFTASSSENPIHNPSVTPSSVPLQDTVLTSGESTNSIQSASIRHAQRVKKIKPRPVTVIPTTTILPPSTTQTLGDIIFESSKETREFHDTARLVTPAEESVKPRKQKQREVGQKTSAESSNVVLAPLVYSKESSEPIVESTSPLPLSSTSVSVSTYSTTTQIPFKEKITKSKGVEFHKSKNIHEKRVTASGAGLGAVTMQPLRTTSIGGSSTFSSSRSTNSPGRVVTTSVTSRVVSVGPQSPQKRLRLRKVKVPNPDAKANRPSSSSTTNIPSTTPISTRSPSRSTTISSTESSLTTTA